MDHVGLLLKLQNLTEITINEPNKCNAEPIELHDYSNTQKPPTLE